MSNTKKVGARIDADLYEEFRQYVEGKHGRTRGVLAEELETAMRNHLNAEYPTDALSRIENDVATIKAQMAHADGGEVVTPPPTDSESNTHTHTPNGTVVEGDTESSIGDAKPKPKAPKSEKVRWFARHKVPEMPIVAPSTAFRSWVEDAWDFGGRAGDDLLRRVFDKYHAKGVKRNKGDNWDVVIGPSEESVEGKITEYGEDVGSVFVLENDDHNHVKGGDVFDRLLT